MDINTVLPQSLKHELKNKILTTFKKNNFFCLVLLFQLYCKV